MVKDTMTETPTDSATFTVFGLPPRLGRWGFIVLGLVAMMCMYALSPMNAVLALVGMGVAYRWLRGPARS